MQKSPPNPPIPSPPNTGPPPDDETNSHHEQLLQRWDLPPDPRNSNGNQNGTIICKSVHGRTRSQPTHLYNSPTLRMVAVHWWHFCHLETRPGNTETIPARNQPLPLNDKIHRWILRSSKFSWYDSHSWWNHNPHRLVHQTNRHTSVLIPRKLPSKTLHNFYPV